MDSIRQLWSQATFNTSFVVPTVLYAFDNNNERFIVISDNTTIYRVMNNKGQVFMIANFRCVKDARGQFYRCGEPMHIISCTKYSSEEEQYAYDVIRPNVFKT